MPQHPRFKPFNFQRWIAENQHFLKPPVGNKQLFDSKTDMTVMIVGGPNQRVDFHDDPVEEFFYQLKGDMILKIAENGKIYDVPIREGDVFSDRTSHPPFAAATDPGLGRPRGRGHAARDRYRRL